MRKFDVLRPQGMQDSVDSVVLDKGRHPLLTPPSLSASAGKPRFYAKNERLKKGDRHFRPARLRRVKNGTQEPVPFKNKFSEQRKRGRGIRSEGSVF